MFKGPEIFITSPDPFSSIYGNTIKIIGQANRANFLLLNGNQIYTDNNGHFEEQLLAPFGYNIIKLQAKDNFGHEKIVVLEYSLRGKIVRFLYQVTEPVLYRIRKVVPYMGGIDLSPLIVIFIIYFFQWAVIPSIIEFALRLKTGGGI